MNTVPKTWRYTLTDTGYRGILTVVDGYAICPKCGKKKLARINPNTEMVEAGLWCRNCGEVNISISPER